MVCVLGYGTVEQFEVVCNSDNEALILIVDHPHMSEAHVFCYGSNNEKKMHMRECNRICNLFAKYRKSHWSFNSSDIPNHNHMRQLNELYLFISNH